MNRAFVAVAIAFVAGVSACDKGAPSDILTNGKKLYSQFNEELIIRHFFDDRHGGTFVDIGAWEWREGSTTCYLEKHLGWHGIAVDAQDSVRPGYEQNRPNTKFFSYAVADKSGEKVKFYLAGPLSSTKADHLKYFEGPQHHKPQEIEVETITLNDLLEREHITTLDFLSMDIEEGEPAALRGFDIDKYEPELVCIEYGKIASDPIKQSFIMKYFADHGYARIDEYLAYDDINWYFHQKRD